MPNLGYRGQPAVEAMMICPKCKATGPASQSGVSGSGVVCDQNAFLGHAVNLWNVRFNSHAANWREGQPSWDDDPVLGTLIREAYSDPANIHLSGGESVREE
jgi:hypothetical protein